MAVKVTFLYNSGFMVETDNDILIFDDCEDPAHSVVKALKHNPEKKLYPGVPTFNIHNIRENDEFKVAVPGFNTVEFKALSVIHGKLPILGYKTGSFAYITDCSHLPEKSLEEIKGLDVLVINALRHTSHPTHFKLLEALNVISMTAPKRAYLTHISHDMGLTAEAEKLLPSNVRFAFDGLCIDLNEPV